MQLVWEGSWLRKAAGLCGFKTPSNYVNIYIYINDINVYVCILWIGLPVSGFATCQIMPDPGNSEAPLRMVEDGRNVDKDVKRNAGR
jgi:hypothetical protein